MAATVTTPVNVAVDSFFKPTSAYQFVTATAYGTRSQPRTAAAAHYVSGVAVRRWNGTAWVTMYAPRF